VRREGRRFDHLAGRRHVPSEHPRLTPTPYTLHSTLWGLEVRGLGTGGLEVWGLRSGVRVWGWGVGDWGYGGWGLGVGGAWG